MLGTYHNTIDRVLCDLTGVTLGFQVTSYSLEEGGSAQVCITFSGDIPDGYSIDFSVQSYAITAESATGERQGVDMDQGDIIIVRTCSMTT